LENTALEIQKTTVKKLKSFVKNAIEHHAKSPTFFVLNEQKAPPILPHTQYQQTPNPSPILDWTIAAEWIKVAMISSWYPRSTPTEKTSA
tara:strand:- start:565 stop:834 length:270 start_codon:yes stop_codon:yes gene_type:complete